jgi:hypothetical protein
LQRYIGQFIVPHEETGRSGGGLRTALYEYFVDRNAPEKEEGNEEWYFNSAVDVRLKHIKILKNHDAFRSWVT